MKQKQKLELLLLKAKLRKKKQQKCINVYLAANKNDKIVKFGCTGKKTNNRLFDLYRRS